jgi:hypothetical protein
VLDRQGDKLQAMLAPLLIDSYELRLACSPTASPGDA